MFGIDIGSVMMFLAFGVAMSYGFWDFYETHRANKAAQAKINQQQ